MMRSLQSFAFSGVLILVSSAPLFAQQVTPGAAGSTTRRAPASPAPGAGDPVRPVSIKPPEHPATPEQVREYLTVTNADALSHAIMSQLLGSMRAAANPAIPPSVWNEMDEQFKKMDLIAAVLPAYQRYLSQEDMAAILAFYRSPAGRNILESQPYIRSLTQESLQKAGREIGEKAARDHMDEIIALQKKLDAAAADGNWFPDLKGPTIYAGGSLWLGLNFGS